MKNERISTLLINLEDYTNELNEKMLGTLNEFKGSGDKQRIAERLLQLISEVELDVVEELYKGFKLKLVSDERSIIQSLTKVLGKKIVESIAFRRNLRNQLVHAYTSYKVEEVFEQAKDTSDIELFIEKVRKVIK